MSYLNMHTDSNDQDRPDPATAVAAIENLLDFGRVLLDPRVVEEAIGRTRPCNCPQVAGQRTDRALDCPAHGVFDPTDDQLRMLLAAARDGARWEYTARADDLYRQAKHDALVKEDPMATSNDRMLINVILAVCEALTDPNLLRERP